MPHRQQPKFPSGTSGYSGWLWPLWRNLVPTDVEFHSSRCPGDRLHCILPCFTLRPECGDIYPPSEWHVCYTLHRGSSYSLNIHTMPGDVYAFLWPSATFFLSTIAIYQTPHSIHISLALRWCHLLQYTLRFGYIACRCICFNIIIFYRSEIYCPIFTLSSTMPSVLHILGWSSIGLRCFIHLIPIRIVAIVPFIPIDITGSQVTPLDFSSSLSSRTSLLSPSTSQSLLHLGIPKWSSSSVQLLSIMLFGSVLSISGSWSANSEVK